MGPHVHKNVWGQWWTLSPMFMTLPYCRRAQAIHVAHTRQIWNFPNFEAFYYFTFMFSKINENGKMGIDNFHGTSWKRVCVLNRTFVCWVHTWILCLLSCLHWWIRCCVVPHVSHFFVITIWDPTLQFILYYNIVLSPTCRRDVWYTYVLYSLTLYYVGPCLVGLSLKLVSTSFCGSYFWKTFFEFPNLLLLFLLYLIWFDVFRGEVTCYDFPSKKEKKSKKIL